MTTPRTDPAHASAEPEACVHLHALFLDTQLDLVLSPGLGRRMRAGLARLVTGGDRRTATADRGPEETRAPDGKGAPR
ncbi:hypothetical protein OG985_42550 [Streptomyces sp. NBC_00289]|uniref:hypothetical protein n=1 Tax=Streptomyces sp. NBC_00289 TaxID=2975703 RepID=UPI00324CD36B